MNSGEVAIALYVVGTILCIGGLADTFLTENRSPDHIAVSFIVKLVALACLVVAVGLLLQDGGE